MSQPPAPSSPRTPRVIILMGVSGSGKTTLGQLLADRMGLPFFDADHFHTRANILKMATGKPLTDADRQPWLDYLRQMIEGWLGVNASAILACSALKRSYRQTLIRPGEPITLVYLRADRLTLEQRLTNRKSHFFKPELLDSQLTTLEAPNADEAIAIDVAGSVSETATRLYDAILAAR